MEIKRRGPGRPHGGGEPRRRIELQLTQDTIEAIDKMRDQVDRSAWITSIVQVLATQNTESVAALVKLTRRP